jgi:beta-glucanase (GH16 family)
MLPNHEGIDDDGIPVASQLPEDTLPLSPSLLLEAKAELELVLRHSSISRSSNLVRFLSFICAKYFEGEAEEIRERTVAIDALGRKEASFDSHADPIVRVTARELRKKLGEFYENEGKNHRIHIILPRGRYIPQFVAQEPRLSSAFADVELAEPHGNIQSVVRPPVPAHAKTESPSTLRGASGHWKLIWKYSVSAGVLVAIFFAGYFVGHRRGSAAAITMPIEWGDPVWSDEFDGPGGHSPDSTHWAEETNAPATPCASSANCAPAQQNASLNGEGQLVLRASKTSNDSWTSARLSTRGIKNFQYGRIEARMKLPVGAGLWPAFVLMGSSFSTVGWPIAGSVDIMENVGAKDGRDGLGPTVIRSTMHGPGYFGQTALWHNYRLPNGGRVDDGAFHTYGIIWSPRTVQFYVDEPSNIYFTKRASDLPSGTIWVFDKPFYIILSLTVGGDWPGSADNTTPDPADMVVDYVRVYSLPPAFKQNEKRSFPW